MFSIEVGERSLDQFHDGEFRDGLLVVVLRSAERQRGESEILYGERRDDSIRFRYLVDDFDGFLVSTDRNQEFRTANGERQQLPRRQGAEG